MPTRVIILGGGVAGMSAAHELIERGFEVVVLERRDLAGGKARSIPVVDEGDGTSGHQLAERRGGSIEHRLPGEHGFRFFPGFYKHVIDTMRRTPSFDGRKVADHLVPTTRVEFTQYGKPTFVVPAVFPLTPGDAGTVLRDILLLFGPITDLTPDDLAFFGARVWQILTSCEERRLGEYERTSWWEFVGAEQRSAAYQKFLADWHNALAGGRQSAQGQHAHDRRRVRAADAHDPESDRGIDRSRARRADKSRLDRSVAQPISNRAACGTSSDAQVEEILCDDGRITGVAVRQQGKRTVVHGDHYVAALPLERIAPMMNGRLLAADPTLANLRALAANVEWMNGVQFYLRRDLPTDARARDSHRYRMGAHQHLAAPVLAQCAARAVRRQRRARRPFGRCFRLDGPGIEWTPRHAVLA